MIFVHLLPMPPRNSLPIIPPTSLVFSLPTTTTTLPTLSHRRSAYRAIINTTLVRTSISKTVPEILAFGCGAGAPTSRATRLTVVALDKATERFGSALGDGLDALAGLGSGEAGLGSEIRFGNLDQLVWGE